MELSMNMTLLACSKTVPHICSCWIFGVAFLGWLQGLPDWAIKYAGGRVMGHSKIYKSANPPFWDWAYWGCHFWPGCHAVVPFAAEVIFSTCALLQDAPSCSSESCLTAVVSAVPSCQACMLRISTQTICRLAMTCQFCDTVEDAR